MDDPIRVPRWMGPAVILANGVALFTSIRNGMWYLVPFNLLGLGVGYWCWRRLVQAQRRRSERWTGPASRYRAD